VKNLNSIYLSLGSNIGDRADNLTKAIVKLSKKMKIVKSSSIYETEPLLFENQNSFLNMILEVDYKGSPDQLLESIKIIENDMGRESTFRYGPRLIDIDIIFFNNYEVNQDNLTIPHYDWKNRLFVIEPLYEVLELELNKSKYKINGQKVKRVGNINL
jgi:2-amino-4-hydroxy-6-hydroxymethyldihydropteridine diphosphokinase